MADDVIIVDPARIRKVKQAFLRGGKDKIQVVADFDKTLTKAFVNGKSIPSIISILRNGNYLSFDYAKQAQLLYDKYHPIEIDPKIPSDKKNELMLEWWNTHFKLLIRSKLNINDIKKAISSEKIQLRDDFDIFAKNLHRHNIPLVILSASGIGTDGISLCLENTGNKYKNIFIISNAFIWNNKGEATEVRLPIIHSYNKTLSAAKNREFFRTISNRTNIILLGDSIEDSHMAGDFACANLLKICFLNRDTVNNLEQFKKAFDVIILNDGSMEYVNDLLCEIIA